MGLAHDIEDSGLLRTFLSKSVVNDDLRYCQIPSPAVETSVAHLDQRHYRRRWWWLGWLKRPQIPSAPSTWFAFASSPSQSPATLPTGFFSTFDFTQDTYMPRMLCSVFDQTGLPMVFQQLLQPRLPESCITPERRARAPRDMSWFCVTSGEKKSLDTMSASFKKLYGSPKLVG